MVGSYDKLVVAAHRGKTAAELLAAPPDAIKGVSAADATRLEEAFGIDTVEEMARSRYFEHSRAILAGDGTPPFDPGPPPDWQEQFGQAPVQHYLGHPSGRFRIEFGPVYYRGRLDGTARVLVLGQDPSTNEILAHRIFIGHSGQRIQRVLAKLGIERSYVMLNTFLFSVHGQFDTELRNISEEPEVEGFRHECLDRLMDDNNIEAVLAFGVGARHAAQRWNGQGNVPVFELTHPAASDNQVLASWNQHLPAMLAAVTPDAGAAADPTPWAAPLGAADMAPIPAFDVPFGVPAFHLSGGGHSNRNGNDQIVWTA